MADEEVDVEDDEDDEDDGELGELPGLEEGVEDEEAEVPIFSGASSQRPPSALRSVKASPSGSAYGYMDVFGKDYERRRQQQIELKVREMTIHASLTDARMRPCDHACMRVSSLMSPCSHACASVGCPHAAMHVLL